MPVEQATHVDRQGSICVECYSDQIEGQDISFEEGKMIQVIFCYDCNSSWADVYKLIGYRSFDKGDDDA